ncbi:intein-containing Rv2578c family radical SAM protein [Blastococcus sp. TF02A-26]|uniref:intein-containing Rv2578c family radical SAM protein n=1 Tax=Blastococcus sp. TF02A-26 TaxID=2250577 RepID=UPI0018F36A09|nr:intein-containing Rv2578c family radical SAM protein [Blastococcus sp. TF02A-26]
MRWDGQRLDADDGTTLPGMPSVRGLLRSVEVPEFPGQTFHEVLARSALNAVPADSAMPFRHTVNPYRGCSHACTYCLVGDTLVLMADGRQKPLADLRVGDRIVGTEKRDTYRHYVTTEVIAHWSTVKTAYLITLGDGTELVASGDHRFLSGRGWKHVTGAMCGPAQRPHLTTNDTLLGFGRSAEPVTVCPDYRRGYLTGMIRGDANLKVYRYARPGRRHGDQHRFRLALADVEGLDRTREYLADRRLPTGVKTVGVRGGLREHLRFVHEVDPAIRRKCGVEGIAVESDADLRVVSIEPLGLDLPMFDITTGTGDFIANGVISHNCYARGSHQWLEMDSGRDFDTQIVVKTNLVEVLRRELGRRSWKREHVALGTNTDPYQRAEGRYRLMPGVIGALADSGTPFSILTKGTLLRRDVPLLAAAARDVPVGLGVSMALWDEELHAALEPGVPSPRARLDLVRTLTDASLPCGVFLAPVLPGLTDGRAELDAAIGAIAAAGATGVTVVPLHLRPGAREWFTAWLGREHPKLLPRYRQLYGRGAYVPAEYRRWLADRVAPLLAAHGLDRQAGGEARGVDAGIPGDDEAAFPAGSLPERREDPAAGLPAAAPSAVRPMTEVPEQLSLM